jgi:hypothetical protein
MSFFPKARTLAAVAAAAGAVLVGASVGGMTSVDRELQAATAPAPVSQAYRVSYETRGSDCPDRHHARDANWREY